MAIFAEGKHTVFVSQAEFFQTQKGSLAVKLLFHSNVNSDSITWTGTFGTPKAMEYTLKSLATCGLKSDPNDIVTLGANAFDGRLFEIEVEKKPGNAPGKFFHNVKWINPIGGRTKQLTNGLDAKTAQTMLSALNASASFKAIKAQDPQQVSPTSVDFF
jgi:hypothetical protein